jgi:ribosome maturation factor RimP
MFPLLFKNMSNIAVQIEELLQGKYAEPDFADCFTVEIKLSAENTLEVFVDSESALDFAKCQKISRYLESFLDENKWLGETYVLEVSSPGASRPLKFLRQFPKHIGRNLEITTAEGNVLEGKFVSLEGEVVSLEKEVKYKEGKKTIKKIEQTQIAFPDIKKAIVKIIF